VAFFDPETGETGERKLVNGDGEAERFYRSVPVPSLIGVESCGNSQWFIDLVAKLGHEVWVGDAAQIRASYIRRQKTDRRDAAHIMRLLMENRFPRLWTPSAEQRDLRQLLIHRHKLVEIRSRVKNGLQHLMLNRGVQKKHKLWSRAGQQALRELGLEGWAARRREDLLSLGSLNQHINELDQAVEAAAEQHPQARPADDATGRRTDHFAGVCLDRRRCRTLSSRQAGGQLSGIDSARTQLGWTAETGRHQQARQSLRGPVAGRSGTTRCPSR
jgi:transposase